MHTVRIRNGLVEVMGKPYNTLEVFIEGVGSGTVVVNKHFGVQGDLELRKSPLVVLEPQGVLLVKCSELGNNLQLTRLEACEHRRGLIVKSSGKKRDIYELRVNIENTPFMLSVTFSPIRLSLRFAQGTLVLEEKPYALIAYLRSPSAGYEPRVS